MGRLGDAPRLVAKSHAPAKLRAPATVGAPDTDGPHHDVRPTVVPSS